MKLPFLIEHYYDHKEENKSLNLVSFLVIHYFYENGTDKDANEDKRLPFKSADIPSSVSIISTLPPSFLKLSSKSVPIISSSFKKDAAPSLSSNYLATIWQPPRCY